ncbi:MAG: transposase [Pirellulaceae bacterium]
MPVSHDAQCHALHSKTPDAKGDVEGLRAVILSKDQHAAHEELRRLVAKYQTTAPSFDDLAEKNAPEGLTIFQLPAEHRERMGMTNPIERLNKEMKRRTQGYTHPKRRLAAPSDYSRADRILKQLEDRPEILAHHPVRPIRLLRKTSRLTKRKEWQRDLDSQRLRVSP